MSFATALSQLAALSVSGVVHNYGIDAAPPHLNRAQLPALLVMPIALPDSLPLQERGEGFVATAFSGGARTVTYSTTHLLLTAPQESSKGIRAHLPDLIAVVDAYFTALGADVQLGGALLEPARVTVEPGIYQWGRVSYVGCAFRHTWLIEV